MVEDVVEGELDGGAWQTDKLGFSQLGFACNLLKGGVLIIKGGGYSRLKYMLVDFNLETRIRIILQALVSFIGF